VRQERPSRAAEAQGSGRGAAGARSRLPASCAEPDNARHRSPHHAPRSSPRSQLKRPPRTAPPPDRICNREIIAKVQQVICFAFHDSNLLLETCREAKDSKKIVTLFYLD